MRTLGSAVAILSLIACAPPSEGTADGGTSDGGGSTDPGSTDDGPTEQPGEFGEEVTFSLRLNDEAPPPLELHMTRDEVADLFGDRAREIELLKIDSTTLLTESLDRIKNACGLYWREDDPNPNHDCSLTPLGQSFVGPDGTWRSSSEYALVRILTMTPANVVVEGTSSESLRDLSDALGIGGGYSQILADALGIPRTASIVSTAGLVESFKTNFVATHPAVGEDAKLSITLEDALTDLATLADRYGPTLDHPGVLDPTFVPHGEVFGPDFQMSAVAASNLRLCDGVDGDQGKGFISVVADEIGPSYHDELELDFSDPSSFSVSGLVDNPTVDIRFRAIEAPQFVPSCLGNPPCQGNVPINPTNASSVWALDPWLLEYNVAGGARNDYLNRTFNGSYLFGTAHVLIGQDGNPPGWLTYDIPLGIGNPPEDQYLWETVLEVGQVALHQTPFATIPEGTAAVAFTLEDVPVGLTGSEAAQAVRPYLQAQASELSDFLLGDYRKNNDSVDFYWRRAEGGVPYLFFVDQNDVGPDALYSYANPGFFRTSALTEKVSTATIPGLTDTSHEKLEIAVGQTTIYFADDGGQTYRARIVREADSDELEIRLARKVK